MKSNAWNAVFATIASGCLSISVAQAALVDYSEGAGDLQGAIGAGPNFNLDTAGTNRWVGSSTKSTSGADDSTDAFLITIDPGLEISAASFSVTNFVGFDGLGNIQMAMSVLQFSPNDTKFSTGFSPLGSSSVTEIELLPIGDGQYAVSSRHGGASYSGPGGTASWDWEINLITQSATGLVPIAGLDILTVDNVDWVQADLFTNLSWNDINAVCPGGICAPGGSLSGYDMTNMIWADTEEVNALFNFYIGSAELGPGPDEYSETGLGLALALLNWRNNFEVNDPINNVSLQGTQGLMSDSSSRVGVMEVDAVTFGSSVRTNQIPPGSDPSLGFDGAWFYRIAGPIPDEDIVAVDGTEWAQVDLFSGLSWNEINTVCPGGVCVSGVVLNGFDMTFMAWANTEEVNALFNYYIGSSELGPGPDGYGGAGFSFSEPFFNVDGWRENFTFSDPSSDTFGISTNGLMADDIDRLATAQGGLLNGVEASYMSTNEENPDPNQGAKGAWFYRVVDIPTPTGSDVEVEFAQGTTLTFDNVTTEGTTSVKRYDEPLEEAPTSAAFEYNGEYFDVTTSALFTGDVKLCFSYSDEGLTLTQEQELKLLHYDKAMMLWEDITLLPNDTDENRICGTTTRFSVFAMALPYDTDGDGVCDGDSEVIGVCDEGPDNCRSISNPGQEPSSINPDCGQACVTSSCAGTRCLNH